MLLQTISQVREWHQQSRHTPLILVPTMGALHEGHLTLMREARKLAGPDGRVAVSIFVNPTQFGPNEDFAKYPRELEADLERCNSVGVDMVFAPMADDIYYPDRSLSVLETSLSKRLCGASRPGHFDGVCLVVLKLFNIIQPTAAVFGKKDYQQLAIIRRMVKDLNVPVNIVGIDTVREPDGLALSSRNRYLTPTQRAQAPQIQQALLLAKQAFQNGETSPVALTDLFRTHLAKTIDEHRIDYIECVDKDQLTPVTTVNTNSILVTAVFVGNTRLIDNLELG